MKLYLFKKILQESNRYQFYNIEKTQGYWRILKLEFYNFYRDNEGAPPPRRRNVPLEEEPVTVAGGVDHYTLEGISLHAAIRTTRFEALEPCVKAAHQY